MKKQYEAPEFKALGSVENLTRGQGWDGDGDQWWFFTWGTIEQPAVALS